MAADFVAIIIEKVRKQFESSGYPEVCDAFTSETVMERRRGDEDLRVPAGLRAGKISGYSDAHLLSESGAGVPGLRGMLCEAGIRFCAAVFQWRGRLRRAVGAEYQ